MQRTIKALFAILLAVSLGMFAFAAEPQAGGRLVVAMGTDPESLDYMTMSSSPAANVFMHIVEGLYQLGLDGNPIPVLATGHEVSADGLVWTLFLREDVVFHDGTPFNADAVKINLDRFIPGARFKFLLSKVVDVEVVDDYTIKLYTEEAFAPMIAHLTHGFIGMISPASIEAAGEELINEPIGTGPFVFAEWVRGEHILATRNENYWGEAPYLDEVMWRIIPEDAARVIALQTGEADVIFRVPPDDIPILNADPDTTVVHTDSVRNLYIGFNTQREPYTDIRVRQAINYAVNKEDIVQYVLSGAGRVADAPIAPGIFGYKQAGPYEYDVEKAKALLAEAGYPDGFKATLYHPTGRYLMDASIAEAVQAQLRDVGIEVELVTMEWATYLAFTRKPVEESELEMYLLGWGTVTGDADYGIYALFHTTQWVPDGSARSFYSNAQADLLMDTARVMPNPTLRDGIYGELIDLLWYEAPWLYLHSEVQINGQRANIHGLVYHQNERIIVTEAWIE